MEEKEKNEKNNISDWGDFLKNLTDEDVKRYKKAEEQSKYSIYNFKSINWNKCKIFWINV